MALGFRTQCVLLRVDVGAVHLLADTLSVASEATPEIREMLVRLRDELASSLVLATDIMSAAEAVEGAGDDSE